MAPTYQERLSKPLPAARSKAKVRLDAPVTPDEKRRANYKDWPYDEPSATSIQSNADRAL